jgi:hypothetical protein
MGLNLAARTAQGESVTSIELGSRKLASVEQPRQAVHTFDCTCIDKTSSLECTWGSH